MGARAVLVTGGVLVVGAVGLVVADQVARGMAEERAAEVIVGRLDVTGTPTVDVDGFPFLTQLLARELDEVHATADGVRLDGVDAVDVRLDARGVTLRQPSTVADATLALTLPTATVQQVVAEQSGLAVDLAVDGDLLRASGEVLGVELTAGVQPYVEDGRLLADVVDVTVGGAVVDVADLAVGGRLTGIEIPVGGLPDGVVLESTSVVPDGLRVVAAGQDLTLEVAP